jgi:hypothetical protein
VIYGIGYAITALGAAFTVGFYACGDDCGTNVYLYPALMFAASELLAIIGVIADGGADFLHLGIMTGLNVAGAAFDLLGVYLFSTPPENTPGLTHLSIGPSGLSLGGRF